MAWSRDGSRFAYGSNQEGPHNIYLRTLGQGEEEQIVSSEFSDIPMSFSPNDEVLLFYRVQGGGRDIWELRFGQEPQPILETDANERAPTFSPSGEFFAYVSDRLGQDEVFVRRYPDTGQLWKISSNGGAEPVWRSDGRELYYRVEDRFMAVAVDPEFASEPGLPQVVFEGQYMKDPFGNALYDVSPDGQRFIVVRGSEAFSSKIDVTLNWFEELRRLAPRD
jgi:Tol biopolymer transport system component